MVCKTVTINLFEFRCFKVHEDFIYIVFLLFHFQIAIACQQDFFHGPKSISGKMATLSILIFCTFIYTAFSAKIVLFLQLSTNKINDVGSVYAAGFDFAVEDQPFNQYYFKVIIKSTELLWNYVQTYVWRVQAIEQKSNWENKYTKRKFADHRVISL